MGVFASLKNRTVVMSAALVCASVALVSCQEGPTDQASRNDAVRDAEWGIVDDSGAVATDATAKAEIRALEVGVRQIAEKFEGEAALAVAVPGSDSATHVLQVGQVSDEAAWSTSKVPVAIAALNNSPDNSVLEEAIEPMIEESDNDAAELAWLSFGGEDAAADAVNEVLEEGKDSTTHFEPWVPPGDVEWHVKDQALFGANLPCVRGSQPVLDEMSKIVDYQSYGLSQIADSRYKGGWGPDEEGGYLIRQFGVIPAHRGELGVAIAARPDDASDDTGREMLDDMAALLAQHLPRGGKCTEAS